jgi:FkbM family methyltransferase
MKESLPPISLDEMGPDFLRSLVGADARVILEIGAHRGWHTAWFLKLFPRATIHAFEPDPRALVGFKSAISDPRVRLFEMAIGAKDGDTEFHLSSGLPNSSAEARAEYPFGWDQSGSIHPPNLAAMAKHWPWLKFESSITVAVRSLDSWAKEKDIGAVDFIWADMQGAEGDLIRGGRETLARTRYVYTEYNNDEVYKGEPNLETLLDMLPGFSLLQRYRDDVLLKNTAFG